MKWSTMVYQDGFVENHAIPEFTIVEPKPGGSDGDGPRP